MYEFEDKGNRAAQISKVKRIVLKVGTRLLMDIAGETPESRVVKLVQEVSCLRKRGYEVVLVTSGAIGSALRILENTRRPKKIGALQAYAALGQCHLMTMYEEACAAEGFHCAQLLLTAADLRNRERHQHVANCLEELLNMAVLPIINENDSVCVDEIKVGDNDTLAAMVASMCRADMTILLTTVDGLCEKDEATGSLGRRISLVHELGAGVLAMAQGTDGNSFSVGGMSTKLKAAAITTCCGEPLAILAGFDFAHLNDFLDGKDVGTLFLPARKTRMHSSQRFIAFFSEPAGDLIVDDGAAEAVKKHGKSLLPSGIVGIRGIFASGATVRICDLRRQEFARGTVNFGTAELSKLCGASTAQLKELLGYEPAVTEAVHRDAMVVLNTCCPGEPKHPYADA